ncbi:MAG: 50S ribosomal protein L9 [Lachnospiraceae bacterium]|nr:50S ribosomal protein L9 [Lachnospiraceae bacterium]
MKVILLQDVKALGKKGDMVEVSDGYARNFILKKKVGVEANEANMNDLKLQKANQEKIAKEQYEAAVALGKELEEITVKVTVKAGEGGKVFGAVTAKEISQELKTQFGKDVDKKKIQLQDSIKNIGSFEVPVKLHTKVTAKLSVKVDAQ